ncbi:hypothetical protein DPMN_155504 [Dreissena polymorpha]|uniref:Uncharacterized protein n=1 Tax=Dreissena polymorpha TaxID=45954 RepID=A0A9D4FTU8_DREPO|nr:hypothetical protein DPMN_155504 [Dreissena polymorpha]
MLSWVPTADQINSIKPDQAVGYWSGSVGMSDPGQSGNGSRSTREVLIVKQSCGDQIDIFGNRKDVVWGTCVIDKSRAWSGNFWSGNFGDWDDRVDRIGNLQTDSQTNAKSANHKSPPVKPINILTNFELDRGIIGTNLLTKFHEDRTRNVARVFKRKTAPPTGCHVFQRTGTTFKLNQHITLRQKILQNYIKIGHEIFKLDRGIIWTNLLTKFHEDQTRNVASRVFTRFLYSQIEKNVLPTGSHVFQRTRTTFELNQHIIKTNIFTKNVASKVFTKKCGQTTDKTDHKSSPEQSGDVIINVASREVTRRGKRVYIIILTKFHQI